jgi:hypothetical protein
MKWRISRAALYGVIAGTFFAVVGQFPPPLEPAGAVHWAYVAGEWTGPPIAFALAFSVIAAIRNLIYRQNAN